MTAFSYATSLPDPIRQPQFYQGVPIKRGVAWVVDLVVIGIGAALIVPFTAFTGLFFFPILLLFVGFLYRWATLAAGSATWGMVLMAIELREGDGQRLTGRTAFWHTLGYSLSMAMTPLQVVSVLMMLITERGQGLTDRFLGTTAINRPL